MKVTVQLINDESWASNQVASYVKSEEELVVTKKNREGVVHFPISNVVYWETVDDGM